MQELQPHAVKPIIAIVRQEWARINYSLYFLFCHRSDLNSFFEVNQIKLYLMSI
jgi:hypothetical protein